MPNDDNDDVVTVAVKGIRRIYKGINKFIADGVLHPVIQQLNEDNFIIQM